jgi:hypothetical protein
MSSMTKIPIYKSCAFVLIGAMSWVLVKIVTNACFWCILKSLWDTLCNGKASYQIQKKFNNYQHATTKNSKGYTSFQRNGLILPMFHFKLCIHHGTHHQIIVKNQNL